MRARRQVPTRPGWLRVHFALPFKLDFRVGRRRGSDDDDRSGSKTIVRCFKPVHVIDDVFLETVQVFGLCELYDVCLQVRKPPGGNHLQLAAVSEAFLLQQ